MSVTVEPNLNVSREESTGISLVGTLVWDSNALAWVKATQAEAGSVGLTDTELRATPVPVSGTVTASGPVTDTQLRAADVKITLDGESVPVTGAFYQATQPISGTVTVDTSLLATSAKQDTLAAKDFATSAKQDTAQTSLTSLASKDFATSAKQDTAQTTLTSLDGKDYATAANQVTELAALTTLNAKDFSTSAYQVTAQTTLSALLVLAQNDAQMIELAKLQLATLRALNLQLALISGQTVEPTDYLSDL